ncbi:CRISPR-associated protein Cas5 [Methanobacterium sp. MZ-A1]|uniref:CRISPR-associated protein Cas5 n=1 Tax=Methanobacterium sp. MZ-A1 TaxID=1911685 RepID=UPI000C2D23DA|nr:CRISPR-associated protein Cas5 [Methanobacterium sp. MZ-A1]
MKVVRFTLEGSMNSFRIPQTSVYQLTYLAPTKTQIVGMLSSIMGKDETDYYDLLRKLNVGIIPKTIDSLFTDYWTFRKLKSSKRAKGGRAVLRREKLYKTIYIIYVAAEDTLISEIVNSLKIPKRIPSLGLDDELVLIKNVKEIKMEKEEKNVVHSIFRFEEGMVFIPKISAILGMQIFPPRIVTTNLEFDNNVIPRKPINFVQIVEFAGMYCELGSEKILYVDQEENCNVDML